MIKYLKDGRQYQIRQALGDDAGHMIEYVNIIAGESDNLTFGPGEFEITLEEEIKIINNAFEADNQLFLIAKLDGMIIGNLNFKSGKRDRIAHTGEFGISVLKEFWGNGVGEGLLIALLDWAKVSNKIKKIDLKVREDNESAINLYKKLGFEKEGLIRRDMVIHGEYVNTIYMGILID